MQMSYEESSNVIKMTGAPPTTDATGKARLNEESVLNFPYNSDIEILGFLLIKSRIHFNSILVWALGCGINGLCDLSINDSFVPLNFYSISI